MRDPADRDVKANRKRSEGAVRDALPVGAVDCPTVERRGHRHRPTKLGREYRKKTPEEMTSDWISTVDQNRDCFSRIISAYFAAGFPARQSSQRARSSTRLRATARSDARM